MSFSDEESRVAEMWEWITRGYWSGEEDWATMQRKHLCEAI